MQPFKEVFELQGAGKTEIGRREKRGTVREFAT